MSDGMPDLIGEDAFERDYRPIKSRSGDYVWSWAQVSQQRPDDNCVWSLIEGDDGGLYASPGYHVVNVVGYIVTRRGWTDAGLDAVWYLPEEHEYDHV